jgi:predicted nuclease with TOPRIM domain
MRKFSIQATLLILVVLLSTLTGCGISKNKYEALLNEKIALEEKLNLITKSRDALRAEYENLLKEKMDLSAKIETATNEKNALKGEYDKLLDEKVTLKAAYDKITAGQEIKEPQAKAAKR